MTWFGTPGLEEQHSGRVPSYPTEEGYPCPAFLHLATEGSPDRLMSPQNQIEVPRTILDELSITSNGVIGSTESSKFQGSILHSHKAWKYPPPPREVVPTRGTLIQQGAQSKKHICLHGSLSYLPDLEAIPLPSQHQQEPVGAPPAPQISAFWKLNWLWNHSPQNWARTYLLNLEWLPTKIKYLNKIQSSYIIIIIKKGPGYNKKNCLPYLKPGKLRLE